MATGSSAELALTRPMRMAAVPSSVAGGRRGSDMMEHLHPLADGVDQHRSAAARLFAECLECLDGGRARQLDADLDRARPGASPPRRAARPRRRRWAAAARPAGPAPSSESARVGAPAVSGL